MKYSEMMDRARFYHVPAISKKVAQGIAKLEAELGRLLDEQKNIQNQIDKIAGGLGLLEKHKLLEQQVNSVANDIFFAKKCRSRGGVLKTNHATVGDKSITKANIESRITRLIALKEDLVSQKRDIQQAIDVAADDAGLLDEKKALKKNASSVRRALGRAKRTGRLPSTVKKGMKKNKRKRKGKSVRTVSGGAVSPR